MDNRVQFWGDDWVCTIGLLERKYPDVNQIIPKSWRIVVSVERAGLLKLLDQSALFTESNLIKMILNGESGLSVSIPEKYIGQLLTIIVAKINYIFPVP